MLPHGLELCVELPHFLHLSLEVLCKWVLRVFVRFRAVLLQALLRSVKRRSERLVVTLVPHARSRERLRFLFERLVRSRHLGVQRALLVVREHVFLGLWSTGERDSVSPPSVP